MKNKDRIKYTSDHRKAFRKIEKQLLGYNTFRSLFHDLDKMFLYMFLIIRKYAIGTDSICLIIMLKQKHILILYNGN